MSSTSSSKPLSLPAARAYYVMGETEGEVAESFTVEGSRADMEIQRVPIRTPATDKSKDLDILGSNG